MLLFCLALLIDYVSLFYFILFNFYIIDFYIFAFIYLIFISIVLALVTAPLNRVTWYHVAIYMHLLLLLILLLLLYVFVEGVRCVWVPSVQFFRVLLPYFFQLLPFRYHLPRVQLHGSTS